MPTFNRRRQATRSSHHRRATRSFRHKRSLGRRKHPRRQRSSKRHGGKPPLPLTLELGIDSYARRELFAKYIKPELTQPTDEPTTRLLVSKRNNKWFQWGGCWTKTSTLEIWNQSGFVWPNGITISGIPKEDVNHDCNGDYYLTLNNHYGLKLGVKQAWVKQAGESGEDAIFLAYDPNNKRWIITSDNRSGAWKVVSNETENATDPTQLNSWYVMDKSGMSIMMANPKTTRLTITGKSGFLFWDSAAVDAISTPTSIGPIYSDQWPPQLKVWEQIYDKSSTPTSMKKRLRDAEIQMKAYEIEMMMNRMRKHGYFTADQLEQGAAEREERIAERKRAYYGGLT